MIIVAMRRKNMWIKELRRTNKKICFQVCMIMVIIFVFAFSAGAASITIDKSKWPKRVVLGGSVLGGPDYIICNGIANILTQKLGLDIAVQATPGNVGNVRLVDSDQVSMAVTTALILRDALGGTGWTKGRKYEDSRILFITYSKITHFWSPADRKIKTLTDLNGKRVNVSKAGSTADLVGRRIFKLFNITPKKITNVSHGDANNLMRDNLLDASLTCGLIPQGGVKELSLSRDVNIIGLNDSEREKMMAKYPYMGVAVIPVGTYKGVDYEVKSVAGMGCFIANKKVPDDFAYMVTKTVLENLDMLVKVHKGTKNMKPENVQMARQPLHKGAYLYYKDNNIPVSKVAMPID